MDPGTCPECGIHVTSATLSPSLRSSRVRRLVLAVGRRWKVILAILVLGVVLLGVEHETGVEICRLCGETTHFHAWRIWGYGGVTNRETISDFVSGKIQEYEGVECSHARQKVHGSIMGLKGCRYLGKGLSKSRLVNVFECMGNEEFHEAYWQHRLNMEPDFVDTVIHQVREATEEENDEFNLQVQYSLERYHRSYPYPP
jgi:hypothetical protein